MIPTDDPVEHALRVLRNRPWPACGENPQLEKRLMQAYAHHAAAPRGRTARFLIPAAAIVVLGGAAFVAAGGVEVVKRWFVTTSVNGVVVDTRPLAPDADGVARFTVPVDPQPGEKRVEFHVQGDDAPGDGPKTVNITLDGNQAQVEVRPQAPGADPAK